MVRIQRGYSAAAVAPPGVFAMGSRRTRWRIETRGLGVRQTLGATTRGIKVIVLRQGRTTVAVGLRVGVVSALGIQRDVSSLLYLRGRTGGQRPRRAEVCP